MCKTLKNLNWLFFIKLLYTYLRYYKIILQVEVIGKQVESFSANNATFHRGTTNDILSPASRTFALTTPTMSEAQVYLCSSQYAYQVTQYAYQVYHKFISTLYAINKYFRTI